MPRLVRRKGLGAAVDIGTTTIVARVYDLATGELIRHASMLNPQRTVSADVMGRISAAVDGRLNELRDSLREAIRSCFGGLRLAEAVVVGNTTMLHLFAGVSPKSYASAPFQAERLFGEYLDIDGVNVRLARCAHAFFGADAVAAVRMSDLCESEDCGLMADIGTNGEIALWRGDRKELTIASVAAGPAFERSGTTASAIVAAIAGALESGAIDATGFVTGTLELALTQEDVRSVQLAKAAVRAGIDTLLAKTGTRHCQVKRFALAGGFAAGTDTGKAVRMGLFAPELLPVAVPCGNLAIEGASAALFDPEFGDATDRIATIAHHVELGGDSFFSDAFIKQMGFENKEIER